MNMSPIEHRTSLRIGAIEFVSPDEIKIILDPESPAGVAANAGTPRAFPRINSYVLIATEPGHIVAQVEWISIERSPYFQNDRNSKLINLPFPLRKMRVNPLGLLVEEKDNYKFSRGIQAFPSVGEPVLIPTDEQLRAIIESGEKRRVKIGTSPLAANAEVCIDPDRLFGRHLAVLGNTGSGKSCSVAGLIHWSLNAAEQKEDDNSNPNARFIILDPNGEYSKAFKKEARVFRVGSKDNPLEVPLWFWNSAEWISFTQATDKTQAPLLKQTLRSMRNEEFEINADPKIDTKLFIKNILQSAKSSYNTGEPWNKFPHNKNFTERIDVWRQSIDDYNGQIDESLDDLSSKIEELVGNHKNVNGQHINYVEYTTVEIDELIKILDDKYKLLGGSEQSLLPKNEDVPIKFSGKVFVNFLESLSQNIGNEQYIEFLLTRIRTILADTRMESIIGDSVDITLQKWLEDYIGKDNAENGCVSIIDLSSVPTEIIHLITSVIARMIFEALQRYRKSNKKSLPTVLVMEEAHTFVKRYNKDAENMSISAMCCNVFEKIAREGRKFGLGLVLSSQRPSELSPTVLSQCNSFLLHRISNDRDQELVNRLVPDNLRGLLRELPSLPTQQAILLGWASELPIMVKMNDLNDKERPRSDDPDFWDVWTGNTEEPRQIDWLSIANEWQMKDISNEAIHGDESSDSS